MDNENNAMQSSTLLQGTPDIFGGLTITQLPHFSSPDLFRDLLQRSLAHWKMNKIRGVWLKIRVNQTELISVAVQLGFVFHHAKPDYLMLTTWLPLDEVNKLPNFASHYVGIGGFVLNSKQELLVVQEKFYPFWKFPGGLVDPGEDLDAAVLREVEEETGIKARFLSLICFRHSLKASFQMNDIYFVARLEAITEEIRIDPDEILKCEWMKLDEFINQPCVSLMSKHVAELIKQELANQKQNDWFKHAASSDKMIAPIYGPKFHQFFET